jgi:hypothetical protein
MLNIPKIRRILLTIFTFSSLFKTVDAADCLLVMPLFPLTYNGIVTPYRLQSVNPADPCTMENPMTAAFVEATMFDPDTGRISVYHPLVVTDGKMPLIPATPFTMPVNAVVSLSFGSNANTLRLTPPDIALTGRCVNGITGNNDLFGQFAYCNSDMFFDKVNAWMASGMALIPPIPPLGLANDGKECLTTRHFMLVDQDPSDNLVTTYLLDPVTMKIFQDTVSNRVTHPGFTIIKNGSDNRLLVAINIAMGCTGYLAPLLSDPSGAKSASLILNELHASMRQMTPMVSLPARDPMTRVLVNGLPVPSLLKNNLYRRGINQPQLMSLQHADTLPFCGHLTNQLGRIQDNKAVFTTQTSPDVNAATNLFTFLATRFFQTYNNLKCDILLDTVNPVTLVTSNGITTDATFAVVQPYQFSSQDPYSPSPPMPSPTIPPTSPPTPTQPAVLPTDPPPTAPPLPSYTLGGNIVYIVFGSLFLIICVIAVVWCIRRNSIKKEDLKEAEIKNPILSIEDPRERFLIAHSGHSGHSGNSNHSNHSGSNFNTNFNNKTYSKVYSSPRSAPRF